VRRFFVACCLLAASGCSLSESGLLTGDGGGNLGDGASADVVIESGALACTSDASTCTSALPTGWTPIAFETSPTLGCPSNFTTSNVVTQPQAQPGACACDCKTTQAPSCAVGSLTGAFGEDNQCADGTNGPFNIITDGECFDWGGAFTLAPYHNWNKLGLTPGTCTSSATLDTSKVSSTPMRGCEPSSQCAEDVCNGTVPAGFLSCIAASGDVICPSGPFSNHLGLVADSIQFTCSACAGCTATGTGCGAATVDYYSGTTCTTSLATDTVNGTCGLSSGTGVTSVTRFKYTCGVLGAACTPGTSTPSPTPTTPRTICCR
jgi:hypothetical protein